MGLKEVPTVKMFNKKADNELELEAVNETETAQTEEVSVKVKRRRFINKAKMKYGTYALAISAIVIAAAVAVNVLFGVLAKRVNLDIDISLNGENTLTEENIEFLKTIEIPVTLTVCSSRESYLTYLDSYTGSSFGVSESGTDYYEQTLRFLDLYEVYSDKITVKYVDLQDPASADVISDYSDYGLNYGDIIVSATHTVNGKENVRDTLVAYDDLYYLSDPYSQYYGYSMGYVVSGNNFESAVSGAIRKVIATETIKVGVFETHCVPTATDYFTGMLTLNNYEIEKISDTIINQIPDEYSMLIISSPKEDFTVGELEAIDTWLYNNGERGRGVLFFANITSPDLPNLYAYLEEWGIAVERGVLFDTNSQSRLPSDPKTMLYSATTDSNDTVDAVIENTSAYIFGTAVPLSTTFETDGVRSTHIPITTYSETVAVAPLDSSVSWEPSSGDTLEQRAGVVVSCEEEYVNNESKKSYVVAFASDSFVSQNIVEYYSSADNIYAAINTANLVTGVEDAGFTFAMKQLESETYTVTESAANGMRIIFQWAIPVLLIACGIFVFVRRMRR